MNEHEGAPAEASLVEGICEMTLEVRDMERMERFYAGLLGCPVIAREPDRMWLACGAHARLGLWLPGRKEFGDEGGRHVHFALSAGPGRLDALAERLAERGIEHRGPVEHDGGDRSLYVRDPEGNVAELWDFFRRPDGAREGVDALT